MPSKSRRISNLDRRDELEQRLEEAIDLLVFLPSWERLPLERRLRGIRWLMHAGLDCRCDRERIETAHAELWIRTGRNTWRTPTE